MLRPLTLAEQVKQSYRSYIKTTFPIADESLRRQFNDLLEEEGLLWRGPFLSLQRPYQRAEGTVAEQASALNLHEKLLTAGGEAGGVPFGEWRLFAHQQKAVEQILTGRNTIVSSGTGSGKTEAFFLPILNDCLKHPGPGIRALILYPMNALANDQYQRFAKYLAGTGVTFARYTGDTPEDEQSASQGDKEMRPANLPPEAIWYRKEIRNPASLPNILMTNYSMLEYLLLRKEDRILFDENLRFLVLDEVHTYSGARGIEVACLLRRLKEHVSKLDDSLVCVGTSATVKGEATEPVADFASELFGEKFEADCVTTETYEAPKETAGRYVPGVPSIEPGALAELRGVDDYDTVAAFCAEHVAPETEIAEARRLAEAVISSASGGFGPDRGSEDEHTLLAEFLGALLSRNGLLRVIEQELAEPQSLEDLGRELTRNPIRQGADETYLRREIEAYLLLGARARINGQPLIRPKVHVFWRGLQGMYRCTAPDCRRLYREFMDTCPECQNQCLPVEVCRMCGQDFYRGFSADLPADVGLREFVKHKTTKRKKFKSLPSSVVLADEPRGEQVAVRFTHQLREDGLEYDDDETEETVHNQEVEGARFCTHCATSLLLEDARCDCEEASLVEPRTYLGAMHKCPACSGRYGVGFEVITPLRSSTMVSINILVEAVFQYLTPEQRRMLVFCDNRQDTAFQAAHLNNKHNQFVGRQLIHRVLTAQSGGGAREISFEGLAKEIYELRVRHEIFCPKEFRDATGKLTSEIRKPENPDEVNQEFVDIHMGILAEIARPGSRRISLEGLGLLGTKYVCADSNLSMAAAANAGLQKDLGLAADELGELLAMLLDEMRWRRAMSHKQLLVPLKGRHLFGRSSVPIGFVYQKSDSPTTSYRTVGFFSKSGAPTMLIDYMSKVIGKEGARDGLEKALDFLIQEEYLVSRDIGDSRHTQSVYMVNDRRLMMYLPTTRFRCGRCGVVAGHNVRGACPRWRCGGTLETHDPQNHENYYAETYQSREPFRMISGEHSAQLSSTRRIQVERAFKEKKSDVLVCTPTMEMGVDIGDLPTVLMRNVPPGPANYAQRSGRAGRQERMALINTFALSRAHDTYFFDKPREMIAGEIEPPVFTIENMRILRRQINSLILEKLDYPLNVNLHNLLTDDDTIDLDAVREEVAKRRGDILKAVLRAFNRDKQEERKREQLAWMTEERIGEILDGYHDELKNAFGGWLAERSRLDELCIELATEGVKVRRRDARKFKEVIRQQGVLVDLITQLDQQYALSYLSNRGFLPSYAFPADTTRLVAKEEAKQPLFRSAEVALVEYAPGNHVYMDGRRYQTLGLDFHRSPVPDLNKTYKRCQVCDVIVFDPAMSVCDCCGRELAEERALLAPSSYVAERADLISADEEYRRRTYYRTSRYLLSKPGAGDPLQVPGVALTYHRRGEVMVVNQGLFDDGARGFRLCTECGYWHSPTNKKKFEDHKLLHHRRKACGGKPRRFDLSHQFHSDVLVLRFEGGAGFLKGLKAQLRNDEGSEEGAPTVGDEARHDRRQIHDPADVFYASLKAALIDAANSISHAEEREIGGFVRKFEVDGIEEREIILYDRVPGGAGYVRVVGDRFSEALVKARVLLDGCSCERSCYRCLRSYSNQFEHALLDKRMIMTFLDHLIAINRPEALAELERYGPGSRPYCGETPSLWLQRRMLAAGGRVVAVVEGISNDEITGADRWAEFLAGQAKRQTQAKILLGVCEIPDLTDLSASNFLAVKALMDLLEAGIEVYRIPADYLSAGNLPRWQITWGLGTDNALAIACPEAVPALTAAFEKTRLIYNDDRDTVVQAAREIEAVLRHAQRITPESLTHPASEGHEILEIRDCDPAVTYETLFREQLRGAKWIRIVDPYIRAEYQVRNLEQFADQVGLPPGGRVELVTMYAKDERYGLNEEGRLTQRLEQLRDYWAGEDLQLTFSFDPTIHDRFIETEKWHIILGRGLDIFYPPEYGHGDQVPVRRARRCTIVYLPKEG